MDDFMNKKQEEIYNSIQEKRKQISVYEDVTQTAKNVRIILAQKLVRLKFKVKSSRFSGGTAVRVELINDLKELSNEELKILIDLSENFDPYESDLMDNRYNVGYIFDGKRRCGASFIDFTDNRGLGIGKYRHDLLDRLNEL